ncbi:MAG TPA: hypothetical protein VGH98_08820 [Gemmatimonadaceae bacterium]
MTPTRWLTSGAWVALLLHAVVGVAALGLAQRAWMGGRVLPASVTGRAARDVGDSGVFASPVLPRNVRSTIPHADAESAAVAMGYWEAPSVQDLTVRYFREIPTERRHFCGRSYYVRPVIAMPDRTVVNSNIGNDWAMWAATWVVPICDDAGRVRTSVHFSDIRSGLRVILGDGPGDVPVLVPAPRTFPHIGLWHARFFPDWERGIGMTPETAVGVAVTWLRGTGARVAEVPEAFTIIAAPEVSPTHSSRPFASTPQCARWRLATLTCRRLFTRASLRIRNFGGPRSVSSNRSGSRLREHCGGVPPRNHQQPT